MICNAITSYKLNNNNENDKFNQKRTNVHTFVRKAFTLITGMHIYPVGQEI